MASERVRLAAGLVLATGAFRAGALGAALLLARFTAGAGARLVTSRFADVGRLADFFGGFTLLAVRRALAGVRFFV